MLSLVWGIYLIQIQINEKQFLNSEFLKTKIIALSKEYIDAVAKEKGLYSMQLEDDGKWSISLPATRELKNISCNILKLKTALAADY